MATNITIGQGIADLILAHTSQTSTYPSGFDGLIESRHNQGLLVWEFEDGSRFRAIIEQVWDPATPPPIPVEVTTISPPEEELEV